MKKIKKIEKEVAVVEGDVCVPCRFPDVKALKTGIKAGLLRGVSADPGSCPGTPPSPPPSPGGGLKLQF